MIDNFYHIENFTICKLLLFNKYYQLIIFIV